jgi:4,5-dihydroxyphthalate decarboxylase
MSTSAAQRTSKPYRPASAERGNVTYDAAFGRRGVTEAIFNGLSGPDWTFQLHEVEPLPRAFRMMVNERSFHVAEMALTTLAMAIERGRPLLGIPAVLNRDFHHRSFVVAAGTDIESPKDLVGRRVGVRAYSQTTGVWARGLLSSRYGIDHESMRWVTFESAHVAEYVDPPHVQRAPKGATIAGMLATGDLDAAVIMDPHLDPSVARPLFPDAIGCSAREFAETGVFPVNHVVAIDTGLLAERPGIEAEVYRLFVESKRRYQDRLATDGPRDAADRHVLELSRIVGPDFNPYGVVANRAACEQLVGYAVRQGLLERAIDLDDLFCRVPEDPGQLHRPTRSSPFRPN